MGYTIEPLLSIDVRRSSHNDERDDADREAADRLRQEIEYLIEADADYRRIVV